MLELSLIKEEPMLKKKLTLKILAFLVLSDILETFIHFCFKKSAIPESAFQIQNLNSLLSFFKIVYSSPFLWLGLLTVLVIFVIWSTILSKIDLSVAVPVASFSYILVPIVSIVFLHEQISILRWAGILIILAGVILVSLTSEEKLTKPVL